MAGGSGAIPDHNEIVFLGINPSVLPRNLRPMRLSRRGEPFDSDLFIYELKVDGFRALAHIQNGQGELISRNGNTFHGLAELATWIAKHLRVESAVLDGEIACLDESGRPTFRDLIFRKRQCIFIAFDLCLAKNAWSSRQSSITHNRNRFVCLVTLYVVQALASDAPNHALYVTILPGFVPY
jgi:ATP-dependent DNA ligase